MSLSRRFLEAMRFTFMCSPEKPSSKGKRVAIVGAGPAGLTIAGYLACKGYEVDVYERLWEPGGLLYFVIPELRVSARRVKLGIEELREVFGVKFYTGVKVVGGKVERFEEDEYVKKEVELEELVKDYDAVAVATGTWRTPRLGIPGEDSEGVYTALDFLFKMKLVRLGYEDIAKGVQVHGKRIAVIGGGIMALDTALEAIYEGATEVLIFYSGTARDAPAGEYAIRSLATRGVRFVELVKPVAIIAEQGIVKGIELVKCRYPSLEPIPGSQFVVDVDMVINAVDVEPTPPIENGYLGIKIVNGRIAVDENHMTTREGIFAAGDVVLGPSKLGYAIRDALYTATSIDRYLSRG